MSKNGSVNVLLAVAVLALGLMAFIGFSDNAIGAVQVGSSPTVSYPTHPDSYYYQQGGATASDYSNLKMMTQDLLQLELEVHCPGAVKPEIVKLCQKYFVSTS